MNSYVFVSTLKDMLRPARIVVWTAVGIVFALVALLWTKMSREPVGADEYGMLVRLIVYRLVALSSAMFTMSVVSQEIEQKTIVYLVTRTIPRNTLLVSRTLSAVVAATLTSWISLFCVAFVMLGPTFLFDPMFLMDLLVMAMGAAAYTSLFVLITLLLNRAMILILLFTFVWESFVPFFKGDMYLLTVNTYMNVLAMHPNKSQGLAVAALQNDATAVAQWVAWTVLPVVAVGLLALGGWWFSANQFLPREDAE